MKATKLALKYGNCKIAFVSPVYVQSMIAYNYFKELFFLSLNQYKLVIERASERSFTFANGSIIYFKSGDRPNTLVGPGYDFIFFEEAGLLKEEVFNYMMPTLLDRSGSCWIFGTPRGKGHWFYDKYEEARAKNNAIWKAFHFTSFDNPLIDVKDIKLLIETLPENIIQQEIYADFMDDGLGVFKQLEKVVEFGKKNGLEFVQDSYQPFYFGLDLAKYQDFTVIYGISEDLKQVYYDRFNQIDWKLQIEKIRKVMKSFPNHTLALDATGIGDAINESLNDYGIETFPFKFTNESKTNLINAYAMDLRYNNFTLPDFGEIIREHRQFQIKYTASRKITYEAPAGKHDDIVIACALANFALNRQSMDAIKSVEYSNFAPNANGMLFETIEEYEERIYQESYA
jgi:hypothetical protein